MQRLARLDTRTTRILICLFLAVGVLTVYGQVAGHDFINYDDPDYVTKNPHVRQGLTEEGILWALTAAHSANWHPLTWLSHMLDWELFGPNPMGHHWTSVLIHLINGILLFLLLEKMTGALGKSALVAAFFAFHPLHVESVAWVSERKDVLCTLFWFSALAAYTGYAKKPGAARYAAVLGLFALSLAAKPMAVTLPFLLLVLDFWPLKRLDARPFAWRILAEKLPLLAMSLASSVVTLWAQQGGGTVASLGHFSVGQRVANAAVSYVEYLLHTIWPAGLTIFYPYRTWAVWQVGLSAGFLAAATLLTVAYRKRLPFLLSGWLWYLGTLVPVIGLVQVGSQRMADRYTYVPLVGIFIIAAWGGGAILERLRVSPAVRTAVGVTAAVALIPMSFYQVGFWENSRTLFSRAMAVEKQGPVVFFQLASALSEEKRFDEAIAYYKKALAMNPNATDARGNLGMTYLEAGRPQEALAQLLLASERSPNDPGLQNNLGTAYLHIGKVADAIFHYEKALSLHPDMVPALYNLSRIYAAHPTDRFRDGRRAVALSERLCTTTGNRQPLFLDILAAAYAEAGDFDRAIETAGRASQLAKRHHLSELADDLKARMSKYRRHEPDRRPIP
ncbi:MAG: tetratricopeptide repeat protein [Desulfobacterales bacterium]|jgi:Tfp pilus assembly protein PilF